MAKEGCDKNCATCDLTNRTYCAVQIGLKNQEILLKQQAIITGLLQVLSPLLSTSDAPITSPSMGDEVPPLDITKVEEVPTNKKS